MPDRTTGAGTARRHAREQCEEANYGAMVAPLSPAAPVGRDGEGSTSIPGRTPREDGSGKEHRTAGEGSDRRFRGNCGKRKSPVKITN